MSILSFALVVQNWEFLQTFPDGPIGEAADNAVRVQLRDANAGFIAAYHEIYAPRVHAGRPANLGHGPRDRLPAFFVQVSSQDLLALAVPPFMEQLLIRKYKLKNNGPPVKVCLYQREYCQYKVQLQWRAGRVGFIKGWSEFAGKIGRAHV